MSRIQINDLNSSDFGFLSELTDEEMSGINGGKWWYLLIAFVQFLLCE
jgi:bacteriocin-like protein